MTVTVRVYAGGPPEQRALEAWRIVAGPAHRFASLTVEVLMRKQVRHCYLCITPMDLEPRGRSRNADAWSFDHVFPRGVGGRESSNGLLAHRSCNVTKGSRWPTPCEVIYLAAVYAAPYDAKAMRLARIAHQVARNNRRRYHLEQANV